MKTPIPRSAQVARQLEAAALDAHPLQTIVVDGALRIVYANRAAQRLLGARDGMNLGDALSCADADAGAAGGCGAGPRCAPCGFHRSVERALRGETARERGFMLRNGAAGEPADLHLLAIAAPFDHDGAPHAILALDDADAILADPGVVRVCEGCGRVRDEEGRWHPLHRYLEDRLALEIAGPLCDACAKGSDRG